MITLAIREVRGTFYRLACATVMGAVFFSILGVGVGVKAGTVMAGNSYTAITNLRLIDTRIGGPNLGPGGQLVVNVVRGMVPASAVAVVINVTATNTTAPSFLTVYPEGEPRPLVSNLNWITGQTVANLVTVAVGMNGNIVLYNDAGQAAVIVDLEGYYSPVGGGGAGGEYVPLSPARILDTRAGSGEPGAGETLSAAGSLNVQVGGVGGVPEVGALAVVVNLTATNTSTAGWLVAYPTGSARPATSNVNWAQGQTVANRAIINLGIGGGVTLFNAVGGVDVIIDVTGYFVNGTMGTSGSSLFEPLSPQRLVDTRATGGTLYSNDQEATMTQQVAGEAGVAPNADAVVLNVTVTNTSTSSFLTVYPGGSPPLASDLNWKGGQTVANMVVTTLNGKGGMEAFNAAGSAAVILDVYGEFIPVVTEPLVAVTTTMPTATQGQAYQEAALVYGGTAPYEWTITSGSLPAGFSMSSQGIISGAAAGEETGSFTVTIRDGGGSMVNENLSLTVIPPAYTISGLDLHDGTIVEQGGIYYMYGTEYGCGFFWQEAYTPWCGYGVSRAESLGGPWSTPQLLFNPNDKVQGNYAIDNGQTWNNLCGGAGAYGCFNPRMVYDPNTEQWILWFNVLTDNLYHGAPAYWAMGCAGPMGPCGSGNGLWDYKPSLPSCDIAGDFSIITQGTQAAILCAPNATGGINEEELNSQWISGVAITSQINAENEVEGEGAVQLPGGLFEAIYSNPGCGYCSGPPNNLTQSGGFWAKAGYATATSLMGPWTARGLLSSRDCTGQPRAPFVAGGVAYEWVDEWTGSNNETTAAVLLEPLAAIPWSCSGRGSIQVKA